MLSWLSPSHRQNQKYRKTSLEVMGLAKELMDISDDDLKSRYQSIKQSKESLSHKESVEILALIVVAGKRALGFLAHAEQVWGAQVLVGGDVAEMKTGEGKTFVAAIASAYSAATTNNVHVVTANSYLVKRDSSEMRGVYERLGLNVSYIEDGMKPEDRKAAYKSDIVYGTSSEFGFDYLRDNLVLSVGDQVQQGHGVVIVDEVDSLLIDEARTPLIISGQVKSEAIIYERFRDLVASMTDEGDKPHYTVNLKEKAVELTEAGFEVAENAFVSWGNGKETHELYENKNMDWLHYLNMALMAKAILIKDRDYVVENNEVLLVDPHTGRIQHGRRWDSGMHQSVEAKERLNPSDDVRTEASISIQQYFGLYKKAGGMTGTAKTEKEEFIEIYGMRVFEIPTNKPIKRIDHPDVICITKIDKIKRIVDEVKQMHEKGRPVLVGTVSVSDSEEIAEEFEKAGLPFEMLNAKNHAREAIIIANAGAKGQITLATSMAGRGTDIILGGDKSSMHEEDWKARNAEVVALGGLHVIGTERHDSRRIDDQIRGRAGRQGDPGSSRFFLSMDDKLLKVFSNPMFKNLLAMAGMKDGMTLETPGLSKHIAGAQRQMEALNFQGRKSLLQFDKVIHLQRQFFYTIRQMWLEMDRPIEENLTATGFEYENYEGGFNHKWKTLHPEFAMLVFVSHWDHHWRFHLERLDRVKRSVQLRSMAQKQPLQEYQKEAGILFDMMVQDVKNDVEKLWNQDNAPQIGDVFPPPPPVEVTEDSTVEEVVENKEDK